MFFIYQTVFNALHVEILVAIFIYSIGTLNIYLNRSNFLLGLVSIEISLLGLTLLFILFSIQLDDVVGQIFAFFILTIAAADAAVGISILISYYKVNQELTFHRYSLRG